MALDPQKLRIEGTYQQKEPGYYMQRVKVPGGVLSAEQARKVAEISRRFAGGSLHLTTRASIELHWVAEDAIPQVARMLASVGLTSRGACGGAVRGIVCSTPFLEGFPGAQVLVRKLHTHFTQNPHFEGLPKKFKISVDAGYQGSRHLIQDVGLVLAGTRDGEECYDVWLAGGLGREPQQGFLFETGVSQQRLIPLIETVVSLYKKLAPAGKRLKFVAREKGEEELRRLIKEELSLKEDLPIHDGFPKELIPPAAVATRMKVEAGVFAGELQAAQMESFADIAARYGEGFLILTCDQNVAFSVERETREEAVKAVAEAGFAGKEREERVVFRVCPGSHECKMGLAPTRDLARSALKAMGPEGEKLVWAISGCPNSCAQPQLAEAGIVAVKLVKDEDGRRRPLFDLYRRTGADSLGTPVRQWLDAEELVEAVRDMG